MAEKVKPDDTAKKTDTAATPNDMQASSGTTPNAVPKANAQAQTSAAGAAQNNVYSLGSLEEALKDATNNYLEKIQGQTPRPTVKEIKNELGDLYGIRIGARNIGMPKGNKWKVPQALPTYIVTLLIVRLEDIKCIAAGGLEQDRTYDMLGIYQETGEGEGIYSTDASDINALIWKYNNALSVKQIDNIKEQLKTVTERVEPCRDKDLVAVGNGIFNYKTKQLMPFTKDIVFTTKCPVDFVPQTGKVVITQPDGTPWDVESWMSSLSDNPEIVNTLWQILGACIRPLVSWNKAAFLYSSHGNNGKGTFCALERELVGKRSCASIPLNEFSKKFALMPLMHASAIVNDENDVGEYLERSAVLKAVITGDAFFCDVKFSNPVNLSFRGFMTQCVNGLPKVKDKSGSFFRRQIFIPFRKCFTGHENTDIKAVYLKDRKVLEYTLWYVLTQVPDYYEISIPEECRIMLEEYKIYNDPVRQFLEEFLDEFVWDLVPFSFLHDLYMAWYKENIPDGKPAGSSTFAKNVTDFISEYDGWAVKPYGRKIAPGLMMNAPEPLIDEYKLTDWMNPHYKMSQNRDIACTPLVKDAYKGGLVRMRAVAGLNCLTVDPATKILYDPRREDPSGIAKTYGFDGADAGDGGDAAPDDSDDGQASGSQGI